MKLKIKYSNGAVELKKIAKGNWIDVYANKDMFIKVGESAAIPLGFALELRKGWEGHLAPRSSTFKTWGLIQTNSVGVVDDTFIGDNDEWHMLVFCLQGRHTQEGKSVTDHTKAEETWIKHGDKIGQFRVMKIMPKIKFEKVKFLENKNRGGLGSTGKV